MSFPLRSKKTKFILSGVFLILISFSLYLYFSAVIKEEIKTKKQKAAWAALSADIRGSASNFSGKCGLVVVDLENGWQVRVNEDKLFPSASIVKIPIMAACFLAYSEAKINLEDEPLLKNRFKVLGSGKLRELPEGTPVKIRDLVEMMIAESDNTAANMLIDLLGDDYLNAAFKKLGLNNTNIARRMMDFKSRRNGIENFINAADLSLLLEKIYHGKLLNKNVSQECLNILKKQKIRDRIPARLPLQVIVAHKTGLERSVCHDAGIVFTDQGDLLVCVLTRHKNKTSKIAKDFIADIALKAYNYMTRDK
ncbi:MAG: serine hydrolase [Candidatus Omnitrophota bacterium]|nr:class A beta-lactamase-related serine hydrolase [Candidatus Omnitrophota bacterium]MBU1928287.1 class A beta-lactamase-related serine hydrolase [Candidatus Omnitrophota bacterium]MBU2035557.1 class A beta-lactamase-related serine hydrolase [Candidatus Omnitrophota bacterium]